MKKILLFTCVMIYSLSEAQVSLVKDINPGAGDGIGNELIAVNDQILFSGNDGANGSTLWVSDGQNLNTNEYFLGSNSFKSPRNFYYWNAQNSVAFSAEVGTQGHELWAANGIGGNLGFSNYNTTGSSDPNGISEFQGYLIFAATSTTNGRDLAYAFSGGSVTEVEDINSGSASSDPSDFMTLGNKFFFSANDGTNGRELWSSTSTAPNTPDIFLDINSGAPSSNPANLTFFNSKIYFTADNGINGRELWVSDGTIAGTQMVLDLYSGSQGSNPTGLTVFNNALYFAANHPTLGIEIFKMTTLENITNLKNISPGSGNSAPFGFTISNNVMYFAADDGTNGVELWSTTGFSSTTNMLKDINPTGESTPIGFTEYFGELYFVADDGVNGRELWKTDGSNTGTVLVDNINPSGDSNPSDLTVANNILFFSADDGTLGVELWKYQDPSLSINATNQLSFALYPNPANDLIYVTTNSQITQISIYDLQGKQIKSFEAHQDFYPIEELTAGLYFINVQTSNGSVTEKLIKE